MSWAAISTSGGKDSLLALTRARAAGVDVRVMLSMLDETGTRNRSHGVSPGLLAEQASRLGLELMAPSASWAEYERVFIAALRALAARGCGQVVFGDIDLQPHRDWEERVCAAAGLHASLPLWGEPRERLVAEVFAHRFRAKIVCVDSRFLDDGFAGREYDAAFVASLPPGVDACGENGEFHTFVYDGPGFATPVPVEVVGGDTYVSPPSLGAQRYRFARLAPAPPEAR